MKCHSFNLAKFKVDMWDDGSVYIEKHTNDGESSLDINIADIHEILTEYQKHFNVVILGRFKVKIQDWKGIEGIPE